MSQLTSANTIVASRHIFSYFGCKVMTGVSLNAMESSNSLKRMKFFIVFTAPGHLATNGLTERYVGEFREN